MKDITHANLFKTTRIDSDSSTILLEAIGQPSMIIIEAGRWIFSKVILCVRENSRCMKQEFTLVSKREETCMMVLFDVLTWTMTEKTLLTCLDKMQPLLGIGWNDLWLSNQMAPILAGLTCSPLHLVDSMPQIYLLLSGYLNYYLMTQLN